MIQLGLLIISLTIGLRAVKINQVANISFRGLVNAQKEYIANIIVSNDNSFVFALVGNSDGIKNKLLVVDLNSDLTPFVKILSKSVTRLETITLDNNYIVAKSVEFIAIKDIIEREVKVVEVQNLWNNSNINQLKILCVKTLNKNSQLLLLTRSKELYIATKDNIIPIATFDWLDNCGTITTSLKDNTIYGLSYTNGESIRRIDYLDNDTRVNYYNLSYPIEIIDFYQQLHVSCLSNYLIYLSPNGFRLYSVFNNTYNLKELNSYNKPFIMIDFVNDNTILVCEYVNGISTLISFDSSGQHNVIAEYIPESYFTVTLLKTLNRNKILLGDSMNLRILEIDYNATNNGLKEWDFNVLIFGVIMAIIMGLLFVYRSFEKEPPPPPPVIPPQLSVMNQESVQTESLSTHQDFLASGKRLIRRALICPLTHEIMETPVTLSDGYSYDKVAIQEWLKNNTISPTTREEIKQEIVPNLTLAKLKQLYRSFTLRNTQP